MKERIVIKDEIFADFLIKNKDNHSISASPKVIMDRCRVEQVPETFEDIKQLLHNDKEVFNKSVKKIEISEFMIEIHFKLQTICFLHNGEIVEPNCLRPIVTGRTPQQMWQIIKNLIGEEK